MTASPAVMPTVSLDAMVIPPPTDEVMVMFAPALSVMPPVIPFRRWTKLFLVYW